MMVLHDSYTVAYTTSTPRPILLPLFVVVVGVVDVVDAVGVGADVAVVTGAISRCCG